MNMSSIFIVIPWQKTNNTALYSRDELAEAKPAVVGIFHIGRASESRLRVSCEGGYYVFQTERVLNFLYFTVKLLMDLKIFSKSSALGNVFLVEQQFKSSKNILSKNVVIRILKKTLSRFCSKEWLKNEAFDRHNSNEMGLDSINFYC